MSPKPDPLKNWCQKLLAVLLLAAASSNAADAQSHLQKETPQLAPTITAVQNNTATGAHVTLKGEVDVLGSYCEAVGLKLSSLKVPAVVEQVQSNSASFAANIAKNDKVLSAKVVDSRLCLLIERNGQKYQATIDPYRTLRPQTDGRDRHLSANALLSRGSFHARHPQLGGAHPFTAQIVAQIGPAGITQRRYPNCWFEASLAAVAATPDGQQTIASMISQNSPGNYIVVFPDSPQQFEVTSIDLAQFKIHDQAEWASIIECAEVKRYPDNVAEDDPRFNRPKIKKGLEMLTGENVQFTRPDECSEQQLQEIIEKSLDAGAPVVVATKSPAEDGGLPTMLTPNHAYSIIAFDRGSGLVTARNPMGTNSAFAKGTNPASTEFHYLDGGFVQMNLHALQLYCRFIAWPTN
jgi:hypothetical protein